MDLFHTYATRAAHRHQTPAEARKARREGQRYPVLVEYDEAIERTFVAREDAEQDAALLAYNGWAVTLYVLRGEVA